MRSSLSRPLRALAPFGERLAGREVHDPAPQSATASRRPGATVRSLARTTLLAGALALAAAPAARAWDFFGSATCECPSVPIDDASTYTTATPSPSASRLVTTPLGQMFEVFNRGIPTAIEIDASWTAGTLAHYAWELYTNGIQAANAAPFPWPSPFPSPFGTAHLVASGTWDLDTSQGSGQGRLRVANFYLQEWFFSPWEDNFFTFVLRKVGPPKTGEATLTWLGGDGGDPHPYGRGDAYTPDPTTGDLVRNKLLDLRLHVILDPRTGNYEAPDGSTVVGACGAPTGSTCWDGIDGAVFWVAIEGIAGPASMRCWDTAQGPECDTTTVYPVEFANQCGG